MHCANCNFSINIKRYMCVERVSVDLADVSESNIKFVFFLYDLHKYQGIQSLNLQTAHAVIRI